ncbi:unnamed protein product [Urochloa humidicola]
MPRRSGGGGVRMRRSSYSASRAGRAPPPAAPRKAPAPAPAPRNKAPAPAPAPAPGGGGILSAIADGYLFGTGSAIAHRAVDAVFGCRKVEHTVAVAPAMGGGGAPPPPSSPCDLHAQAFQDCINHNGSDISRCQFYVDLLNDCRRRGQVADVQASG